MPIGIVFLVIGVALGLGTEVMESMKEDQCDGSLDHWSAGDCYTCRNATANTLNTSSLNCNNGTAGAMEAAAYVNYPSSVNVTQQGVLGTMELTSWLPTLALILIASIVIGIVVRYFVVGGTRR